MGKNMWMIRKYQEYFHVYFALVISVLTAEEGFFNLIHLLRLNYHHLLLKEL